MQRYALDGGGIADAHLQLGWVNALGAVPGAELIAAVVGGFMATRLVLFEAHSLVRTHEFPPAELSLLSLCGLDGGGGGGGGGGGNGPPQSASFVGWDDSRKRAVQFELTGSSAVVAEVGPALPPCRYRNSYMTITHMVSCHAA